MPLSFSTRRELELPPLAPVIVTVRGPVGGGQLTKTESFIVAWGGLSAPKNVTELHEAVRGGKASLAVTDWLTLQFVPGAHVASLAVPVMV